MKIFNFNLIKKFLYFVIVMVKKLLYFRTEVAHFFVHICLSVSGRYLWSSSFRMAFKWSCFVGLAWRTKGSAVTTVFGRCILARLGFCTHVHQVFGEIKRASRIPLLASPRKEVSEIVWGSF
jgi:hypothetical protein